MTQNSHGYTRRGDAAWLYTGVPDWSDDEDPVDHDAREALAATIGRAFHVRVLKEIARLSEDYPGLPLILTENKVSIPCTSLDGFEVSIETHRGHYIVALGEWSDEFALVGEAIELLEAALLGEIRLRDDVSAQGQCWLAEKRLLSGQWIGLPRHEDPAERAICLMPIRTKVLRNSYLGFASHAVSTALRAARGI